MQYTSVSAAMEFGQFIGDDVGVLLNALIESATKVIDNHCHRIFRIEDETTRVFTKRTRREDAFDGVMLYLDEDLAEEASAITGTPTVLYVPENIPPYFAIEIVEGSWEAEVSVTGYWGYSRTPPPDIEFACLRLVKWMYDLRDTTQGSAVIVTPEGRVLLPQGLPSDIVKLLEPYVKVSIA